MGTNVRVTREIQADTVKDIPDDVIRKVPENSRTLNFDSYGFEEA